MMHLALGLLALLVPQEPPAHASGVVLALEGAVVWSSEGAWFGPTPARLAPVPRLQSCRVAQVELVAGGFVAKTSLGCVYVRWDDVDGEPLYLGGVQVDGMASDGRELLALEYGSTLHRLDAEGRTSSEPFPHGVGPGTAVGHGLGRWFVALLEPFPEEALAEQGTQPVDDAGYAGDLGYGGYSGQGSFEDELPPGRPRLFSSPDGHTWSAVALPDEVVDRELPIVELRGDARLVVARCADQRLLVARAGGPFALVAPALEGDFVPAPYLLVLDGTLHTLFPGVGGAPTFATLRADGSWERHTLAPEFVAEGLVRGDGEPLLCGRRDGTRPRGVYNLATAQRVWEPDLGPWPLPGDVELLRTDLRRPIARLRLADGVPHVLSAHGTVHALGNDGFGSNLAGDGRMLGGVRDFVLRDEAVTVLADGDLVALPRKPGGEVIVSRGSLPELALRRLIGNEDPLLGLAQGNRVAQGALRWIAADARPRGPADVTWLDGAARAGLCVLVGGDSQGAAQLLVGTTLEALARPLLPPLPAVPGAVALGPEGALAVGPRGLVLRAPDGLRWSALQLEDEPELVAVAQGAGQWGVLDRDGRLLLSPDGERWHVAAAGDAEFVHLAGDARELVALDSGGLLLRWRAGAEALADRPALATRALVETEAIARVEQATPTALPRGAPFGTATWDGARFLAADAHGLLVSADGNTFHALDELPQPVPDGFVRHAGEIWSWAVDYSRNASLARRHLPGGSVLDSFALELVHPSAAASNGERLAFVSTESHLPGPLVVAVTADRGASWERSLPPLSSGAPRAFAAGHGLFVLGGRSTGSGAGHAAMALSRDGLAWQLVPLDLTLGIPEGLAFIAGRFVASVPVHGGRGHDLLLSSDARAWQALRFTGLAPARLLAGETHLFLHDGRRLLASADGLDWRVWSNLPPPLAAWLGEHGGLVLLGSSEAPEARTSFWRLPAPEATTLAAAPREYLWPRPTGKDLLDEVRIALQRAPYTLLRARALEERLAAVGPLEPATLDGLAELVLARDRSPQFLYLAMVLCRDDLLNELMERLAPEERAALGAYARAVRDLPADAVRPLDAAPERSVRVAPGSHPDAEFDVEQVRAEQQRTGDLGLTWDLALAYQEGYGVARDEARQRTLQAELARRGAGSGGFEEAAKADSILACQMLGLRARDADDQAGYHAWMRRAAARGGFGASHDLATAILLEGDLRAGNVAEAHAWLARAAQAGYADAMNLLAITLRHGLGVPVDESGARWWFEQGARHGSEAARKNLEAWLAWQRELDETIRIMQTGLEADARVWSAFGAALGEHAETLDQALEGALSPK